MTKQDNVAISQDTMLQLCLSQAINHCLRNRSHFSIQIMLFHLAAAFIQSPLKWKEVRRAPWYWFLHCYSLSLELSCASLQTSTQQLSWNATVNVNEDSMDKEGWKQHLMAFIMMALNSWQEATGYWRSCGDSTDMSGTAINLQLYGCYVIHKHSHSVWRIDPWCLLYAFWSCLHYCCFT